MYRKLMYRNVLYLILMLVLIACSGLFEDGDHPSPGPGPGDLAVDDRPVEDRRVGTATLHDLNFMVGTWKTSGIQDWGDGTWVAHKGIVEATISEDGHTIVRTFWASFDNGVSLGGKSTHEFNTQDNTWYGRWVPTVGTWNSTPAKGEFRGPEYREVATGSDARGTFTNITRAFDISESSYRVVSDLHYDSGDVSIGNWQILFEKIPDRSGIPQSEIDSGNRLDFLLGEFDASGTLLLPDGSTTDHRSFVDAHLGADGTTVEREFWGAIGSGGALRGLAEHSPTDSEGEWRSSWTPMGASSPASETVARFEGLELIERQPQQLNSGPATVVTRYYDTTPFGYAVQSDIEHENGDKTIGAWVARFKRIR